MRKRPGPKYAMLKRLDSLMVDGQSRRKAKDEARLRGEPVVPFTTGKIHSFETRENYQKIVMRFIDWVRDRYDLHQLDDITARADQLVTAYLSERIEAGYSAWTLATERSALRMAFSDRELAADVLLLPRRREEIKRSRRSARRDKNISREHWQDLIQFCLACGLRREELRDLKVGDVYQRVEDGRLIVHVRRGKGGKAREVEVFPGREQAVLSVIEGRDPGERVFSRLSQDDLHAYRRQFAQDLYVLLSGRPLPPAGGRLNPRDIDHDAAAKVSKQLGHERTDVIFKHYIR